MATASDRQAELAAVRAGPPSCRSCGAPLFHTFVDLGSTPLANAYLTEDQLAQPEVFYPLRVYVCERCFLVQLPVAVSPEHLFSEYAYLSSYSESWLRHAEEYAEQAVRALRLDSTSRIVEVASNDGYLLQYFKRRGIPVLGVEPARNAAEAARAKGIPTIVRFFGSDLARLLVAEGRAADLLIGNNVLAHVPDLNDFVEGIRTLLRPDGVATFEFPHVLRLIEKVEFDTIYHEHVSYLSLIAVERVFAMHALVVCDVDELPTHGGSLRLHVRHADAATHVAPKVEALRRTEQDAGLDRLETYADFARRVADARCSLLEFLLAAKRSGKSVVGYGAAAKGNTLLNYCGVRSDLVEYVVDRSPLKQGLFLPGTHIPISDPSRVAETCPDYLLILPWNIREEVMEQMSFVRGFGCRFVVPIPKTRVLA